MSASNPPFFFQSTQSVDNRLGDMFGFVWASYAGLRELWWQVRGFQGQFPDLHIDQIKTKFLSGLPLPGGIDLARMCLNREWRTHEQEFSKWILFEACTLYEGWAEKVCSDIFPAAQADRHAKNIQFPTGTNKAGNPTGFTVAVAAANASTSPLMVAEFLPVLKASKLNRWSTVEEHLIAYRFFKECRNAFIHSDGVADQALVDARALLGSTQAAPSKPFRHAFALPPMTVGAPIELNIKDCVLFATVVRLLICTFDAAFSVSDASEAILEVRLRSIRTKNGAFANLPGDPIKREQRIRRLIAAARIPVPLNVANVTQWMTQKGIVR
ncbi:hypothetical protein ACTSKR_15155 [Chitinibacteraceae bacterium HSL-7]